MTSSPFLSDEDEELGRDFLDNGYVVFEVEDREALKRIQSACVHLAAEFLGHEEPRDHTAYLDAIHEHLTAATLNDLRLHVINGLKKQLTLRQDYFALARHHIEALVGNELAMQRSLNMSVQLPGDDSSLLPIHADVWDGNSPFEIVVWLPLVDCFGTKAMYLVPPSDDKALHNSFADFADKSAEDIYQAVKDRAKFLKVNFGQVMIFSQTLMHGNRVNTEDTTRWSMNVRFKGVLTPYADKKLGEYFEPITTRAVTTMGLRYQHREGFDDA